jgi:hypothetical protein
MRTRSRLEIFLVVAFLVALVAPMTVNALNQTTDRNLKVNAIKVEQTPDSVAAAFDAGLNAHDVNAGLDLFADNAFVHDLARETYSYLLIGAGPGMTAAPTCSGDAAHIERGVECSYNHKDQIREWLQQLAFEHIQVQEVGGFQVIRNNVTWNAAISIDPYRSLGIAPLAEVAQAVVQGGKIQSLTLSLTNESVDKLEAAVSKNTEKPRSGLTSGFLLGIVSIGLFLPAAAIYYISRVKSLFAAVPRLQRPWFLLLAGVASLFLAALLIFLRGFASIPSWDAIYSMVMVLTGFFILASMVLMKQVWTVAEPE